MNFFGSEKYFQNRTPTSVRKLETELDNRTPHEWFMAPNNKKHVAAQLLRYRIILDEIGLQSNMNNWARKNRIDARSNADRNSSGLNDYMVVLDANNAEFINYMRERHSCFDQPLHNRRAIQYYSNDPNLHQDRDDLSSYNMVNGDSVIQDGVLQPARYEDDGVDTMVVKKASEMTAADMRNLNVYDPTYDRDLYAKTIGLALKRNGKNRFQKNMHARHNDRGDTEGWRSKDEDMGSRGNLVRKFDMSEFRKYAVNAHRPLSHNQFQY